MPVYPKAGVSLDVDSTDWNAEYKTIMAQAGALDSLSPTIKVDVDDGEISTALLSLTQLEDDASVKINVDDGEISSALLLYDDMAEDQSVSIDVEKTEVDETVALLQQIRNLSLINIVLNVPQQAMDFINKIPGVAALFEQMGAANILDAALPQGLEGGAQMVSDLYTEGFGESREEVARFVAMLSNIGIEQDKITGVATDLFEAQAAIEAITGTEPDMISLLSRVEDLTNLGLADSYKDATDVIVAGFQSSIGLGGDFLGDLGEFAPTFATLGFTSEQMLATLNTGLAGGVDNISRMSEGLISFNENASLAPDTFIAAIDEIDRVAGTDLGAQLQLFQDGEMTGADYMASVLEGARQFTETQGITETQSLLGNIFGGTASNIGAQALLNIDPNSDAFATIEDRSQNAADAARDTWETAFMELQRTINDEIATTLDETFDLTDRLDTAKEQFGVFVDSLKSGESFGDAIEIAFGIPGVDTALGNVERVFGQFVLTLLEIVATIQDPLGINDNDKGTRGEISRLATQQLPFDLQLANPEEFDAIFTQAAQRGVSLADMGTALTTALDTSVSEGDFDRTKEILANIMADAEADPASVQALVDKYNVAIDEAMAASPPPAEEGWWNRLKPPDSMEGAKAFTGPESTGAKGMEWWSNLPPPTAVNTAIKDTTTAIEESGGVATTWADTITTAAETVATSATTNMGTAVEALDTLALAGIDLDTQLSNALTENTVTASFDTMSASATANAEITKAAFTGILATVSSVDARLTTFFHGVMAKVAIANEAIANIGVVPPGGGGNTTNNNVVVNNTNNVQSGAQATALGYELGAQVRGFG